jgi:hypothetical protein
MCVHICVYGMHLYACMHTGQTESSNSLGTHEAKVSSDSLDVLCMKL